MIVATVEREKEFGLSVRTKDATRPGVPSAIRMECAINAISSGTVPSIVIR
jgi:hypothetical protein